ncbi:hypothetical protein FEF65_01695 [Mariprofundus erugo]|uniref:Uncharacterized protein n=1 Tax=Mariprofundus erugo TaxID=2528639 RepID=A0A5R9GSR9_9PROT|nr:hypothetical protein [Mariprofundus erugo]TLS69221.1 hypothetical protein FEF65_01695 [Mariprofundus erugo]
MKIENGNNYLELEVSLEEDETLPSYGDAYVIISVNSNGFSGKNDLWVSAEGLQEFCASLVKLEKERIGEATLSSISPGELDLKIYSVDSLGHLAVAGTTGYEVTNMHHSLTFGFEFEGSQLVKAVALPWVKRNAA